MARTEDADPPRHLTESNFPSESRSMSEQVKRGMTLGMIVGNRGFFPDHLARSGHQEVKAALESAGTVLP